MCCCGEKITAVVLNASVTEAMDNYKVAGTQPERVRKDCVVDETFVMRAISPIWTVVPHKKLFLNCRSVQSLEVTLTDGQKASMYNRKSVDCVGNTSSWNRRKSYLHVWRPDYLGNEGF